MNIEFWRRSLEHCRLIKLSGIKGESLLLKGEGWCLLEEGCLTQSLYSVLDVITVVIQSVKIRITPLRHLTLTEWVDDDDDDDNDDDDEDNGEADTIAKLTYDQRASDFIILRIHGGGLGEIESHVILTDQSIYRGVNSLKIPGFSAPS